MSSAATRLFILPLGGIGNLVPKSNDNVVLKFLRRKLKTKIDDHRLTNEKNSSLYTTSG